MTGISTGLNLAQTLPLEHADVPPPVSGGTIAIVTGARSNLMCAPDSVRFTADLSLATFDAPAPVAPAIYDARMHDLIYVWNFGDGSDALWTAPVNTLDFYKNRNIAKGPNVAHVYRGAGTYLVTLTITEPSSGKASTITENVTVVSADSVYPTTQTICVNPVGDTDFSDAPTGAKTINQDILDSSVGSWFSDEYTGTAVPKRWLFKRGASYTDTKVNFDRGGWGEFFFGDYGDPSDPQPVINVNETGSSGFYCLNHIGSGDSPPDVRFSGLNMTGNFDPVTELTGGDASNYATGGISLINRADLVVSQCQFSGLYQSNIIMQDLSSTHRTSLHIDDCILTAFGGQYPVYMRGQTHPDTAMIVTGSRLAQTADAVDDNGTRAPIRSNHAQFTYFACNDFYVTDTSQPCLKALETPEVHGCTVNIHGNAFEGGDGSIYICTNATQGLGRSSVHNVIIDSNIALGMHSTRWFVLTRGTGCTIRNNLFHQPDTETRTTPLFGLVVSEQVGVFNAGIVGAAPVKAYNNTMQTLRALSRDGGPAQILVADPATYHPDFTAVTEHNNIVYAPNEAVPQISDAPLSTTVLFPARYPGRRDRNSFDLDVTRATPADTMQAFVPLVGSAALGAALTGDVSYHDIQMQLRPDPPSRGAWEAD